MAFLFSSAQRIAMHWCSKSIWTPKELQWTLTWCSCETYIDLRLPNGDQWDEFQVDLDKSLQIHVLGITTILFDPCDHEIFRGELWCEFLILRNQPLNSNKPLNHHESSRNIFSRFLEHSSSRTTFSYYNSMSIPKNIAIARLRG